MQRGHTNIVSASFVYPLVQSSSYLVGALDVDSGDQVPVGVLHVLEADIAQNTGIVDKDVDAAEGVNGSLDDLVTKLDAVVVCNGLASSLLDLVDDDISGLSDRVSIRSTPEADLAYLAVVTLALEGASQVVHDNIGTSCAEECSICSGVELASSFAIIDSFDLLSESATSSRYDDGLPVIPELRHVR